MLGRPRKRGSGGDAAILGPSQLDCAKTLVGAGDPVALYILHHCGKSSRGIKAYFDGLMKSPMYVKKIVV